MRKGIMDVIKKLLDTLYLLVHIDCFHFFIYTQKIWFYSIKVYYIVRYNAKIFIYALFHKKDQNIVKIGKKWGFFDVLRGDKQASGSLCQGAPFYTTTVFIIVKLPGWIFINCPHCLFGTKLNKTFDECW